MGITIMATAQSPPTQQPSPPPIQPQSAHHNRVLIHGVSWDAYGGIGERLRDLPVFMTYSNGALEITTRSLPHERARKLLGRFVETLTEELGIDIDGGGSTTMRRENIGSGL